MASSTCGRIWSKARQAPVSCCARRAPRNAWWPAVVALLLLPLALPVAAQICSKLYQGLDITPLHEHEAEQLSIEHPPGALDELGRHEIAVALELALEMALGTAQQVRLIDRGPTRFLLTPTAATPPARIQLRP